MGITRYLIHLDDNLLDPTQEEHVDIINHPPHYTYGPKGIPLECREYTRHLMGDQAAAAKYVYRGGEKADIQEDLDKAENYLVDQITHEIDDLVVPHEILYTISPNTSLRAHLFYLICAGETQEALERLRDIKDLAIFMPDGLDS